MSLASPQNREELKSYIKTRLGAPVLQINVSDEQMDNFIPVNKVNVDTDFCGSSDDTRQKKRASMEDLSNLLEHKAEELCFYETKFHCFFGSFFDWRAPGGYIHVSPVSD